MLDHVRPAGGSCDVATAAQDIASICLDLGHFAGNVTERSS